MNRVDRFIGTAFKATIVLYVVVFFFKTAFRPDIYRILSVPLEGCIGLMLVYIGGRWVLTKLGISIGGISKLNKTDFLKIFGTVFALVCLVAGAEYFIHNFSVTERAVEDLQASKDGNDALGVPIRIGWFISGDIKTRGGDGNANLSIQVRGSKSAGELEVEATRKEGSWHINELYLIPHGKEAVQTERRAQRLA
jgi:hypothetical protein